MESAITQKPFFIFTFIALSVFIFASFVCIVAWRRQLPLFRSETVDLPTFDQVSLQTSDTGLNRAIDEKKSRLLNMSSISFHYIDKERITSFFNDHFQESTVESTTQEHVNEISGDLTGKLPALEANVGGKTLTKSVSNLTMPNKSLHAMFLLYQREIIRNDQVVLDVEMVDVELSELEAFELAIADLAKSYGFVVDADKVEAHRKTLKEKAAEQTLVRLESVSGFVIIEGAFEIRQVETDFYGCVYKHPVTGYMLASDGSVTITVRLEKKRIEEYVAVTFAHSGGSAIPLHIYGKVWKPIDRSANEYNLEVIPLAIY